MLTGDSDVEEMLAYLEKRHPLYFVERKLSKEQIRDLIKRLKFRVGQMKKDKPSFTPAPDTSKTKPSPVTNKENVSQQKVTFKSGS